MMKGMSQHIMDMSKRLEKGMVSEKDMKSAKEEEDEKVNDCFNGFVCF